MAALGSGEKRACAAAFVRAIGKFLMELSAPFATVLPVDVHLPCDERGSQRRQRDPWANDATCKPESLDLGSTDGRLVGAPC